MSLGSAKNSDSGAAQHTATQHHRYWHLADAQPVVARGLVLTEMHTSTCELRVCCIRPGAQKFEGRHTSAFSKCVRKRTGDSQRGRRAPPGPGKSAVSSAPFTVAVPSAGWLIFGFDACEQF